MITQRFSPPVARALRHGSVVAGAALWFMMSGCAAAHADVTLPGDTGPATEPVATEPVTAVTDPVLQPVVEAAQPVAQDPVVEAVEPAVQQPVKETVELAVQQPVKQVVRTAEQTVAPVVRVVEPAVQQVAQAVQPVDQANSVTASSQEPVAAGTNNSHAVATSGQSGAPRDSAPAKGSAGAQGPAVTHLGDLRPRTMGGPASPTHGRLGDDHESDRSPEELEAITNELMHLYAGDDVPVGIGSGLSGVLPEERRLWLALLVLGMLLGVVAIERARRGSDDPVG